MCEKSQGCQQPEELKGTPEQCSPEQIRQCHGDAKEHPCVIAKQDVAQEQ